MRISLIVAGCQLKDKPNLLGIGQQGNLPWRLKTEMAHFTKMTKLASENRKNAVLMGRKTWESIPSKFRPLPQRFNAVITSNLEYKVEESDAKVFHSIEDGLEFCRNQDFETCWIIGGSEIYNFVLKKNLWDRIYLTKIGQEFACDRFFPESEENWTEIFDPDNVSTKQNEEKGINFTYHIYEKKL